MFVNFKIDPNFPEKQYVKIDNTIVTPLIQKEIIHLPRCHRIYCTAVDMGVGISKKEPDYGIEVSLDGNQYQFYDADPEKGGVKIPTPGLHTLKFRTRDLLGNTSEPLVFNVFVDVITPVFFITPKYGKLIFFPPLEVDDECAEPIPPVPAPPADPQQPPPVPKAPIQPPELKIKEWEGMVGFEFYIKKRMFLPGASYLLKDFEKIENEDQPSGNASEANKDNAKDGQTVQYSGEAVVNNEKFDVGSLYEDVQGNKVFTYLPGVKNEFKITGMDPSGVPEILIRIDRGSWDVYKGAVSFYTNGVHILDIKAIDGVGNVSYGRQKIFIDNIPPTTIIQPETNKGGLNIGDNDVTPRGSTPESGSGDNAKNTTDENNNVLEKSDEKE